MFAFRIRVFCFIIRFIRHSVRWLVTSIISRKTHLRSSSWMVAWTKIWQRMFEEHLLPRTFEEHLLNVRLNVTLDFTRYNDFECCHLNVLQCGLVQSLEACGMTLHISDMFLRHFLPWCLPTNCCQSMLTLCLMVSRHLFVT